MTEDKIVRWGILGAGNIAHRFAASLRFCDDCILTAISGRNIVKLDAFVKEYLCPKEYIGYENLLADPEIDAVYLALPHGMHSEWAIKAMQAGKAVLCEKPAALNQEEVKEIATVSRKTSCLFMEAMKSRFEPAYQELKKRIQAGSIGTLQSINTSICFLLPPEMKGKTYHFDSVQGGALLDSGIYCASLLLDYFHGSPRITILDARMEGTVDVYINAYCQFNDGSGSLEVGFDRILERKAVFCGSEGEIILPDLHRPQSFIILKDGQKKEISIPYIHDDFYLQIRHFTDLYLQGKTESPVMSLADSEKCAALLDQTKQKAITYSSGVYRDDF